MVEEGFSSLCKVRQDVGEKLAFPQQLSEKGACRDVGRRVSEPQRGVVPGSGTREKVCCGWVPSSDSVCHSCATWARQ